MGKIMMSSSGILLAALSLMAATTEIPVLEFSKRTDDEWLWPMKPDPDNRGRRAEKDRLAMLKAEAKRERKAAKRRIEGRLES